MVTVGLVLYVTYKLSPHCYLTNFKGPVRDSRRWEPNAETRCLNSMRSVGVRCVSMAHPTRSLTGSNNYW
ncbi:hypothetical protein SAMN05192541_1982 [Bradyrhizobium arachidis]|nr:hypothetical protein SAMN05192541_1982 [Bradyrhizobium arachidis]